VIVDVKSFIKKIKIFSLSLHLNLIIWLFFGLDILYSGKLVKGRESGFKKLIAVSIV